MQEGSSLGFLAAIDCCSLLVIPRLVTAGQAELCGGELWVEMVAKPVTLGSHLHHEPTMLVTLLLAVVLRAKVTSG